MRIFEESAGTVFRRLRGGYAVLFLFALAGLLLNPLAGVSYQAGSLWTSHTLALLVLGLYFGYATGRRKGRLAHILGNALVLGYSAACLRILFTFVDFGLGVGGYHSDPAASGTGIARALAFALYPIWPWAAGNLGYFLGRRRFAGYLSSARAGLVALSLLGLVRFAAQPFLGLEPAQGASWLSVSWGLLILTLAYSVAVARRGGSFADLLGTCLALSCINLVVAILIVIDDGLGVQTWYTTPPATGNPGSTAAHVVGHVIATPISGTLMWVPASLVYLISGGRRAHRHSLREAQA